MTKTEKAAIFHIANLLDALADPTSTVCAVDPAARKAASAYLKSWCIPQLRAAIKPSHQRTDVDQIILKAAAKQRQFT
jgi:hypothetical protein